MIYVDSVTAEILAGSWASYNSHQQVPVVFQVKDGGEFPVVIYQLAYVLNGNIVFNGIHYQSQKKVSGYCIVSKSVEPSWIRYVDSPPP